MLATSNSETPTDAELRTAVGASGGRRHFCVEEAP